MERIYDIKDIAIYLRKSRNDPFNPEKDVLSKHESELIEFAQSHNWKYTIYKEIGSGESIDERHEMIKLLKDVELGLYDGVLVIDYDRLGRGDYLDQAKIRSTFRDANAVIITPQKVYDVTDENQELILDIEGFMARQEYRLIKKRLLRGKKLGVKEGNWTNGKPPYPYIYDRESKEVKVDTSKLEIYNLIKTRFLSGDIPMQIMVDLNTLGVPSPNNKLWSINAIYRLLTNEVHLGKVIYGKTKGNGHKNKKVKNPVTSIQRENWLVKEGALPVLKTEEEHNEILSILQRRKIIPLRSRRGTYVFSGLIYCGICNRSMQFISKESGSILVKKCQHVDPFGNKCDNRGIPVDILHNAFNIKIEDEIIKLTQEIQVPNTNANYLIEILSTKQEKFQQLNDSLSRIKELYEMGDYEKIEYQEKRDKRVIEITKVKEEIGNIRTSIDHTNKTTQTERLEKLIDFQKFWNETVEPKEKNKLLKRILFKISYIRIGDDVNIEVEFL